MEEFLKIFQDMKENIEELQKKYEDLKSGLDQKQQGKHLYSVKKLVSSIEDNFFFGKHWINQKKLYFS